MWHAACVVECRGYIKVRIVNHDEYEKNQKFIVKLGDPRHITADKSGD